MNKAWLIEFPCRYLVVSVVSHKGSEARLIVARCRDSICGQTLLLSAAARRDSIRAELWYLHGKGKRREVELLGTYRRKPDGSFERTALASPTGEPDTITGGPLVLPVREKPGG